ncbi:MAG: RES domain-containing protein [Betaproteobacteria bacterium]|nr:RES domain-containing protein [Betaproteobacteria bacterium]
MELKSQMVEWRPSWRIIPSRFPSESLFDRVADPADLEAVYAIEALTNQRLRQEVGEISLVAPEDRVSGPGSTPVMAAFTHLNPTGSRFSDGSFGVYYAGGSLDTAIAETRFHRERFMAATAQPAMELDMRTYLANVSARLIDIRGRKDLKALYDPDSYLASQPFGVIQRRAGTWGIVYDSVRWPDGECVALFKPRALKHCRQGAHLVYAWNGQRIEAVYEKRLYATYS